MACQLIITRCRQAKSSVVQNGAAWKICACLLPGAAESVWIMHDHTSRLIAGSVVCATISWVLLRFQCTYMHLSHTFPLTPLAITLSVNATLTHWATAKPSFAMYLSSPWLVPEQRSRCSFLKCGTRCVAILMKSHICQIITCTL